ncbi:hypothetical protein [Streptomyces sp. Ac-502]|uniref:hypothetical protein n=1 Tax=Streptomyces sp. Ac-502 TaxID=3342801 RepID=UPI00386280E9
MSNALPFRGRLSALFSSNLGPFRENVSQNDAEADWRYRSIPGKAMAYAALGKVEQDALLDFAPLVACPGRPRRVASLWEESWPPSASISFRACRIVYSGPRLPRDETLPEGWRTGACDECQLAELLHTDGSLVVALSGRAELGPRTLGSRSILVGGTDQYLARWQSRSRPPHVTFTVTAHHPNYTCITAPDITLAPTSGASTAPAA